MPSFNDDAVERIRQVVRYVEANVADNVGTHHLNSDDDPLVWMKLTTAINTTTGVANANPGVWSSAGNGSLSADTNTNRQIRDTTNGCKATNGSWVICRPIGSDNGTVWEPLASLVSAAIFIGKLSSVLNQGSSANCTPWSCSNGSFAATGNADVEVYDWLMKASSAGSNSGKKITYTTIGDTLVVTEVECP